MAKCSICLGTGFEKYDPVICNVCDGIKCMMCNSSGLLVMPWDTCHECYGCGEVEHTSCKNI